jgi:cytochrome c-type biogenesis protein CcmH/NrfG
VIDRAERWSPFTESEGVIMDALALLIAILALILAGAAYRRSGGLKELRAELESATRALGRTAHAAREKTADLLEHLEDKVRENDEREAPKAEGD